MFFVFQNMTTELQEGKLDTKNMETNYVKKFFKLRKY